MFCHDVRETEKTVSRKLAFFGRNAKIADNFTREILMFDHVISRPKEQLTVAVLLALCFLVAFFSSWNRMELSTESSKKFQYRVDINRAGAAELQTLPGIGEKLAEGIIAFRENGGPIESHEELLDVKGIGPKKLEAVRPFLADILPSGNASGAVLEKRNKPP